MLLLHSDDSETFFFHKIDQPLSFNALVFRITGTNPATALTRAAVGRIRYSIRQKVMVDASFEFLSHMGSVLFGHSEFLSTVSGAMNMTVIIPRFYLDDNIEYVTKEDNATFEITFGSLVVNQTSFLAELYARTDEGLQNYNLRIIQAENSLAGAGTFAQTISSVENICSVFLGDTQSTALDMADANTAIDRIQGNVGGKKFNMSRGAAVAATNMVNDCRVSSTVLFENIVEIFSADVGDLSSRLDDSVDVTLTLAGAALPQFLVVGMDFNPNKQQETAFMLANKLGFVQNQKAQAGKHRTVTSLARLSQAAQTLTKSIG